MLLELLRNFPGGLLQKNDLLVFSHESSLIFERRIVMEHFDVIIVGAGISGVSAAVHLGRECPDQGYCVLERRENVGGT